ncbi:MAG: hypothetical protein FWC51_02150 [Proteobacteria bacterium]|nr:hypothetical protein [Pseudomonadota bacterium]
MKKILIAFLSILILPMAARAAVDVTPDIKGNIFIKSDGSTVQPYAALCSVHAYNIGQTVNPSGELKATMDDVVKLKTTLLTLEMKRQYDMLDSTIKRLETQLQKAMLVAKLEAAGATPSTGGASGGGGAYGSGATSPDGGRGIAGIQDCQTGYANPSDVYSCVSRNIQTIRTVAGSASPAYGQIRYSLCQQLQALNMMYGILNQQASLTVTIDDGKGQPILFAVYAVPGDKTTNPQKPNINACNNMPISPQIVNNMINAISLQIVGLQAQWAQKSAARDK